MDMKESDFLTFLFSTSTFLTVFPRLVATSVRLLVHYINQGGNIESLHCKYHTWMNFRE